MCGRCEPSSSSSQSLSPLLCLYWACRSLTPLSTIRTSRRPAVDTSRRLTRPAGKASRLAVDASWRDFLYSGETFFTAARPSVSRRDFLPIPARLSVFWQDFLPIPTGAGHSSAILASLAIFATLATPAIRSFKCHFLNGKKIHADPRQGDRREDFERALNRGPREFSRSSEKPLAPLTHDEEVL